jgi:site-specific DNA-methyltransferase (adenine-specific)
MKCEGSGWTMYMGDSRDVVPTIAGPYVLVTDPPYGVNLGDHLAAKDRRRNRVLVKDAYNGFADTLENLRTSVVPCVEAALTVADRGAVFCAGTRIREFPEPSAVGGVYLPAGCGRSSWGFTNFAHVLFYGKAPDLEKGARPTGISSTETAESNGHPVPKPVGWMLWLVTLTSRVGDVVLDPFAGSATTGIAAMRAGRRFVGIERDPEYFRIACDRLKAEESNSTLKAARTGQTSLFGKAG